MHFTKLSQFRHVDALSLSIQFQQLCEILMIRFKAMINMVMVAVIGYDGTDSLVQGPDVVIHKMGQMPRIRSHLTQVHYLETEFLTMS